LHFTLIVHTIQTISFSYFPHENLPLDVAVRFGEGAKEDTGMATPAEFLDVAAGFGGQKRLSTTAIGRRRKGALVL